MQLPCRENGFRAESCFSHVLPSDRYKCHAATIQDRAAPEGVYLYRIFFPQGSATAAGRPCSVPLVSLSALSGCRPPRALPSPQVLPTTRMLESSSDRWRREESKEESVDPIRKNDMWSANKEENRLFTVVFSLFLV